MHPFSFAFKRVEDAVLSIDVFLPSSPRIGEAKTQTFTIPAVVWFHGGGLTVGNRQSWFPQWLYRRIVPAGCIFISAEHRLIPPSNGHDILADIKDLFQFLAFELNPLLRSQQTNCQMGQSEQASSSVIFAIDVQSIAVAGCSAGGFCSYLAAMHAVPRPKAILSLYGMGGDFLSPHWFTPKTEVFFRGYELLDPARFSEFIYPACCLLPVTVDSAPSWQPPTSATPGYPANPRMQLARLYIQMGVYLDYFTGFHEPSLSAALRELAASHPDASNDLSTILTAALPEEHRSIFPQLGVNSSWPSTFLVHGSNDSAVRVQESQVMSTLLNNAGVEVVLRVVEGKEHSFDLAKDADELYGGYGGLFDDAAHFLLNHLGKA
ncbi:alpha/beta-hydrolase [Amylocystis lapponica]|nr:alpha/beta-hydrolase [Amylocystis lapponica]